MTDAGRIILATGGSLGDLHPFIALGRALQARDFTAGIATAVDYREKIEAAVARGLDALLNDPAVVARAAALAGPTRAEDGAATAADLITALVHP